MMVYRIHSSCIIVALLGASTATLNALLYALGNLVMNVFLGLLKY